MTAQAENRLKMKALRQALVKLGIDGFIVPRTDAFQGEYVPAHAERLCWLTGFSGSWGTAIVGSRAAALIVDGRYTIQAANETKGLNIEILSPEDASLIGHLRKNYKPKAKLGFDPWLSSVADMRRLKKIATLAKLELVALDKNPIDQIWKDQPAPPANPIIAHPQKYAGQKLSQKLQTIAKAIDTASCDAVILADPLAVTWALNIRGSDIPHTPAALLRAIVFKNGKTLLFADRTRVSRDVNAALGNNVRVLPELSLLLEIKKLGKNKNRVLIDPAFCPEAIRHSLERAGAVCVDGADPCSLPRARKNTTEQKGARTAQIRDGAAVCNFLCWLENELPKGSLTEKSAQDKLLTLRTATGKLLDLSFGTISASGPNAAQPHYHVQKGQGRKLKVGEIYLIDSGGQYRDGTTDITRTTIVGTPTAKMKKHFTLVLKGMIAVSIAKFPAGTNGAQIDALARSALWHYGFDFDHGTGHGVGSYLSVHEGPARISKAGQVALVPGMILSNEPGYYLKGKYGIRIENLLLVSPARRPKNGDRKMLSFETLTFAPISKELIDSQLMTRAELQWLDNYHAEVYQKIGKHVNSENREWLARACAPITRLP